MKEDMEKLFDLTGEKRRAHLLHKIPPQRPAYSYTSICPDKKFRIEKKPVKTN